MLHFLLNYKSHNASLLWNNTLNFFGLDYETHNPPASGLQWPWTLLVSYNQKSWPSRPNWTFPFELKALDYITHSSLLGLLNFLDRVHPQPVMSSATTGTDGGANMAPKVVSDGSSAFLKNVRVMWILVIIDIIPIIRIIDDVMSSHAHSGVARGHGFLLSTDSFTLLNSKIISEYWLSCDTQSRLSFDDWLVV